MARIWRHRNQRAITTGGMVAWVALASLFLLWQIVQYRGAMAVFAEWQFNTFGRYFPSLTYMIFVALLTSPAFLLFYRARRRDSEQRLAVATMRSAIVFLRVVLGVSIAAFLAAIVTLILILSLPRRSGEARRVDLSQPFVLEPRAGPTTIIGSILYDRTAAFDEDLIVTRRNVRFAPVVAPGKPTTDLQFFVELPTEIARRTDVPVSMTGVLKRNSLPGEIVRLYRYAGYRVEPPYYVVYASDAALRWPYFEVAAEFCIVALLFLGIAAWQSRRIKQIEAAMIPGSSA